MTDLRPRVAGRAEYGRTPRPRVESKDPGEVTTAPNPSVEVDKLVRIGSLDRPVEFARGAASSIHENFARESPCTTVCR